MKSLVFIVFLLLLVGAVSADISIIGTSRLLSPPVITPAVDEGLVITPSKNVSDVHVFLDGVLVASFDSLTAHESYVVPVTSTGVYDFEVRYVITEHYEWENFKITRNDEPLFLAYVSYDQDHSKVNFALKGADALHPDKVSSTALSVRDKLFSYRVLLNNEDELSCYPLVTTGKPVPFNCYAGEYPRTLSIDVTIGIREKHGNVTITSLPAPESGEESRVKEVEGMVDENITVVNESRSAPEQVIPEQLPVENVTAPSHEESRSGFSLTAMGVFTLIVIILIIIVVVKKKKK